MNFSWKRWKMGLCVSCLTGFFTGLAGLAAGITWKQFLIIVAVCIGKDAGLFLKQHPVDSIEDTTIITKPL